MTSFRPKYITFDCYGTLTRFRMSDLAREVFADRVAPAQMDRFIADFAAYRLDEVLGAWTPYADVIENAARRACTRWRIEYRANEGRRFYDAVPTWGPHADVPEPLARVARHYPLVILSNASDDQIHRNVAMLGAPFHAVFTAQQANAYKPRLRAFEYMLDQLGCHPEDVLHVSAHMRYDVMPAHDLGIRHKVLVARGYDPPIPYYGYDEIKDLGGLPGIVGVA